MKPCKGVVLRQTEPRSGKIENPSPVKKGCGDQHGHGRTRRTSLFKVPLR